MAIETINGVKHPFGPRSRFEGVSGSHTTQDAEREYVVWFDGANYTLVSGVLPAGTVTVTNALVEVVEAFALGGTTPTLNLGVSGSAATNRLAQLSEAQAEAIGTYSVAPAGTLALNTPLAAAATIKVELGGTTPTITSAGKCKIAIRYRVI